MVLGGGGGGGGVYGPDVWKISKIICKKILILKECKSAMTNSFSYH